MKLIISLTTILFCGFLNAQQELDTIYANDTKNVALFFPKPIRQGITGASHFVFTYNREKEKYFGLLQAQPGEESNLLTITNDGQVYSYILKYSEQLAKMNYFIDIAESIGNEKPKIVKEKSNVKQVEDLEKRFVLFERFSKYLLKRKSKNLSTKRNRGLKLQLQKMVHQGSEVYLVLEFSNNSGIDFEIDYLNIYRVNGNKKRKASYQKLQQEVVYKYKFTSVVKNKQSKRFVFVLPKFVLGNNEKLQIESKEFNGGRKIFIETK